MYFLLLMYGYKSIFVFVLFTMNYMFCNGDIYGWLQIYLKRSETTEMFPSMTLLSIHVMTGDFYRNLQKDIRIYLVRVAH